MGETEATAGTVAPELGDCVSVGDHDCVGESEPETERVEEEEGEAALETVTIPEAELETMGVEVRHSVALCVGVTAALGERGEALPEKVGTVVRTTDRVGDTVLLDEGEGIPETVGCVEGSVLVATADTVRTTEVVARGEAELEKVAETEAEEDAMLAEGARETVTVGEEVWLCESVTESEMVGVGPGEMTVMVGDRDAEVDRLPVTDTAGEAV